MKLRLQLISLLLLGQGAMHAQTQFWSDNFEDAGAPSSGSRTTSIAEFGCNSPSNYYFKRTDVAGIYASVANPSFVYANTQGTKFWAAMDIDRGPACINGNNQISAGQTITWSGINIAGKTGLSFKGLFGANTSGIFQGTAFPGAIDSMVVEYRINGGAWTKIVGIYCNNSTVTGGPLAVDNNNDLVGDGSALTLTLAEVSANISGTGTTLDLRFDIFNNNTAEGSMAIDNFRLFEGVPLSVSLASFEAVKENSTAVLRWTTQAESENAGFDIQRSTDGKSYQTIGSIASKAPDGNSHQALSYNFQDKAPVNGLNLYRLAEKDKQGHITYSDVRSVNFDKNADFSCYPNPVQSRLTLKYNSDKDQQVSVRVSDVMGKTVLDTKINMKKGFNEAALDMSGFTSGIYSITLVSHSGVVYSSRVSKQ